MDTFNKPLNQKPSLVVKLHYKPICTKCTDLLSRWCAPWSQPYPHWELEFSDPLLAPESLSQAAGVTHTRPTWTYHLGTLRAASASCRCCKFLLNVLNAIPGMQYSEEDYIRISSELAGSQHVTPYQRAYVDWLSDGTFKTSATLLPSISDTLGHM
jgi:hypothetical protein